MEFGKWLEHRRIDLEITVQEQAERYGVTPNKLRKIKANTEEPPIEFIQNVIDTDFDSTEAEGIKEMLWTIIPFMRKLGPIDVGELDGEEKEQLVMLALLAEKLRRAAKNG